MSVKVGQNVNLSFISTYVNINVILNSYKDLEVSAEEVTHAIKKLEVTKARGSDGVYSEHIKYSSNILVPLLKGGG